MIGNGDRDVTDRNLPGANELVTADEPAYRAIADGDEESFIRYRGQT
jgi:hypothetical protein